MSTIRLVLALATQFKWKVHQMDVKSAFLNGDLQEEVYMTQPPRFKIAGQEQKVCRLAKALYGLKQAPQAWYMKIDQYLTDHDFQRSPSDANLYIKHTGDDILFVVVYVDDLIIAGSSAHLIHGIKQDLCRTFDMTDLGLLHYCLGVEVWQTENHIFSLSKKLVGSLIYLTATRPDISFAVSYISRFMSAPKADHWIAAKRVLRYVRGTSDYGLLYTRSSDPILSGYTDFDWAGSVDDRKSTAGYVFSLGSSAVTWTSKK
eukprot:PITA_06481